MVGFVLRHVELSETSRRGDALHGVVHGTIESCSMRRFDVQMEDWWCAMTLQTKSAIVTDWGKILLIHDD
jgi:hypothetical protein